MPRSLPPLVASLGLAFVACAPEATPSAAADRPSPPPLAAACPSSWLASPPLDPTLTPPAGGVVLHTLGVGTQDYRCTASPDGGTAWTFAGPEAALLDCRGASVGHHFASDAGPGAPAWQLHDGSSVVARKLAAVTHDGGAASVPWLLLQATEAHGPGALGAVRYVERASTDGGVAPAGSCTPGDATRVPYSADYYFVGP